MRHVWLPKTLSVSQKYTQTSSLLLCIEIFTELTRYRYPSGNLQSCSVAPLISFSTSSSTLGDLANDDDVQQKGTLKGHDGNFKFALTDLKPATMQPFRFFDLPAEIRSIILRLALEWEGKLHQLTAYTKDVRNLGEPLVDTQLLATSRQMQVEALPIFYGYNTFCVEINNEFGNIPPWITYPTQTTSHIRKVLLEICICVPNEILRYTPQFLVAPVIRALKLCPSLESLQITVEIYCPYVRGHVGRAADPSLFTTDLLELFVGISGNKEVTFATGTKQSKAVQDFRLQRMWDSYEGFLRTSPNR